MSAPNVTDRITMLRHALQVTALMLDYEATCHEESGDPKRRRYVAPLRQQVAQVRAVLLATNGAA